MIGKRGKHVHKTKMSMAREALKKQKKYERAKMVLAIKPALSKTYSQAERNQLKEFEKKVMGY